MIVTNRVTAKSITVAGGNLFQIASVYLGDATQWNRIAALNGLTDPMLTGVVTIKLPPFNLGAGNGGVLNA
jgi:nucleoid-associated protein YgaU